MNEEKITVEEKLRKYEALLEEVVAKEIKREAKVLAGPDQGFYKVKIGNEELIVKSPMYALKKGDSAMIINGAVVGMIPESLITHEEEDIEFTRIGWDSVGGMKSQIEAIRRKVEYPQQYKRLYAEFKLPLPKGILLHGPTGCGKTLIAKAIASSMIKAHKISKQLFIYLKGGELLSKYVGEAENRIKNAFQMARKTYKSTNIRPIIFIDEAEAILPQRGSRLSSDVDTTIVPTFLSEMDGFEGNGPFVLLATNYEERIDSAILRPGRIDLKVYVGRPTIEDCVDIFKIHLSKTKVAENIDTVAKSATKHLFATDRLVNEVSGALIENLVFGAVEFAMQRCINDGGSAVGVTKTDLINSINSK